MEEERKIDVILENQLKDYRKITKKILLVFLIVVVLFFVVLFIERYVGSLLILLFWLILFIFSIVIIPKLFIKRSEIAMSNREAIAYHILMIAKHKEEYIKTQRTNKNLLIKIKEILSPLNSNLNVVNMRYNKSSGFDENKRKFIILFKQYIKEKIKPLSKEEFEEQEAKEIIKDLKELSDLIYDGNIEKVFSFFEKQGIKKRKGISEKFFSIANTNKASHIITIILMSILFIIIRRILLSQGYITSNIDITQIILTLFPLGIFGLIYPKTVRRVESILNNLNSFLISVKYKKFYRIG